MRLAGKNTIVTGAARGMALELARYKIRVDGGLTLR